MVNIDYTPSERLQKIIEIMAEGALNLLQSESICLDAHYLTIRDIVTNFKIKQKDIIYLSNSYVGRLVVFGSVANK